MDETVRDAYVVAVVNLLLFLSALLSALTGVSGSARVATPAAVAERVGVVAATVDRAQGVATRPVQGLSSLAAVSSVRNSPSVTTLPTPADALTNRRRE